MARRIVISGGPGGGKTTLLNALAEAGFATSGEAGRAILQQQAAIGGPASHTTDNALYAELMLSWDMRSYDAWRGHEGDVFFDRSVTELVGYFQLIGRPVPAHFQRAAALYPYHEEVFIAPAWEAIYVQDDLRKQDFAEARRSYEMAVRFYGEQGYRVVELPKTTVAERVAFVRTRLGI